MRFGEIEVLPLSDGLFHLDGGAMFGVVPRRLWERRTTVDGYNRIPLALRPLLIRTNGQNVLVDAGLGDKLSAKELEIYGVERARHLDHALAAANLTPADVDVVIASHLHFDHAGGFTVRTGGEVVPRFPRARYVVRRGEWEDAMAPNERNRASYLRDNLIPLVEAGVLDLIDDDGEVVPGVSVWRTGGHTMHHQVVRITGGGRTGIFAADLVPTAAHVDLAWIMAYDLYPLDTLEYKRTFLREAIEAEYVIFFEHDPRIPAGIIREDAGRLHVQSVET